MRENEQREGGRRERGEKERGRARRNQNWFVFPRSYFFIYVGDPDQDFFLNGTEYRKWEKKRRA